MTCTCDNPNVIKGAHRNNQRGRCIVKSVIRSTTTANRIVGDSRRTNRVHLSYVYKVGAFPSNVRFVKPKRVFVFLTGSQYTYFVIKKSDYFLFMKTVFPLSFSC